MIRQQAENLRILAAEAHSAAGEEMEGAALAEVVKRLQDANDALRSYGVTTPKYLEQVDTVARATIRSSSRRLEEAVRPMREFSMQELAAHGRGAEQGQLRLTMDAVGGLRESLQLAHEALLRAWRERIWPAERALPEDILSRLGDPADVRTVKLALERIDHVMTRPTLEELERARTDFGDAEAAAQRLIEIQRELPPGVDDFLREVDAAAEQGVELSRLSVDTHRWLAEHGAVDRFTIRLTG